MEYMINLFPSHCFRNSDEKTYGFIFISINIDMLTMLNF